jgi:hypothetical protein
MLGILRGNKNFGEGGRQSYYVTGLDFGVVACSVPQERSIILPSHFT